jgi:hypothetical protein
MCIERNHRILFWPRCQRNLSCQTLSHSPLPAKRFSTSVNNALVDRVNALVNNRSRGRCDPGRHFLESLSRCWEAPSPRKRAGEGETEEV